MKELETNNFLLRRFKITDAEDTFKFASNEKIARNLDFKAYKSIEEIKDMLETAIKEFGECETYWAVEDKQTHHVIGYVKILHASIKNKRCNLLWGISTDYWGKGISEEILRVVIKYLLENKPFELIEVEFYSSNKEWPIILEKIGMKKEAALRRRKIETSTNEIEDKIIYSIVKEEINW